MMNELCSVCGRVRWGAYQPLGFGKWRHEECYPGTQAWREYWVTLPASKRTPEGNLIFNATREEA